MWETLLGLLLGSGITWLVSWHYYRRAGDELRQEAAKLRKLSSMILSAMERQGWAKLNRDSAGNIKGFTFKYVGSGGIEFEGSAKTEFAPAQKNRQSEEPNT